MNTQRPYLALALLSFACLAACAESANPEVPPGDEDTDVLLPPDDADLGDAVPGDASGPGAPSVSLILEAIKALAFSWEAVEGADEYRMLENADGQSGFSEVAVVDATTTQYRHEVFLPSRVNASYTVQACNDVDCTDSETVVVEGSLAEAVGYLKASNNHKGDPDPGDYFGNAVALSADGRTLAVGAYREDSAGVGVNGDQHDHTMANSGAVYVFRREEGGWEQHAYLKASDSAVSLRFGTSVALSADGRRLAVGAMGSTYTGSVYMYVLEEEKDWREEALLTASNADSGDAFGGAVALSADGNRLAVGARQEDGDGLEEDDNSATNSGAVYIFDYIGTGWVETAYLKAPNLDSHDYFGWPLVLSGDGNTVAVAALNEASGASGVLDKGATAELADNSATRSGAVYIFGDSGNGNWDFQHYLKASNNNAEYWFGEGLALSGDGRTLVVGAPGDDSNARGVEGDQSDNSAENSGAAYVFVRDGDGWRQQAYLKASNTESEDWFGNSIAISADGNTLAIGAWGEDSGAVGINGDELDNSLSDPGAVYLFQRDSGGLWQQFSYVKASNTDNWDYFGEIIALSADASVMAVGATYESSAATGISGVQDENSAENSGAVYLY